MHDQTCQEHDRLVLSVSIFRTKYSHIGDILKVGGKITKHMSAWRPAAEQQCIMRAYWCICDRRVAMDLTSQITSIIHRNECIFRGKWQMPC